MSIHMHVNERVLYVIIILIDVPWFTTFRSPELLL
jgi:hypothetical protein